MNNAALLARVARLLSGEPDVVDVTDLGDCIEVEFPTYKARILVTEL